MGPTDTVRIFVGSPGDVDGEREQLNKVVQELNTTLAALVPERGLVLELIRWETHTRPGLGADPQDVVNRQLNMADVDVFIGIMWRRFGTPTERSGSGTEEEFRIASESWRRNRKPQEVLFYFCQAPSAPPATEDEAQQQLAVTRFRQELTREALVREYEEHSMFGDLVRPHLVQVISSILRPKDSPSQVAERASQLAPRFDVEETRRRLEDLGREYDDLRNAMEPGDARTRRLETVVSRMKTLALSAYPLVPELCRSPSAGVRLAAVATLATVPRPDFLEWLAERLPSEKPFVGYHAALALLSAARTLDAADLPRVRDAIAQAQRSFTRPDTDRDTTLRFAEEEVTRRLSSTSG